MTDTELKGRVALITGAGRGLGLGVAEELAQKGMHIAGMDVREDELRAALEKVGRETGIKTLAIRADLRQEEDIVDAVKETVKTFGQIHVLVNNAGIREVAPIWEVDTEMWDRIQSVNLRGEFLCTREVLRQSMLEKNEGTIVFVSSVAGKRGSKNGSAYAASKWGVLGLAASVALDLKDTPIRVTSITPGRTETPMARESEVWDPDIGWLDAVAVAKAIVFCIQQDSDTIIPELHVLHRAEI